MFVFIPWGRMRSRSRVRRRSRMSCRSRVKRRGRMSLRSRALQRRWMRGRSRTRRRLRTRHRSWVVLGRGSGMRHRRWMGSLLWTSLCSQWAFDCRMSRMAAICLGKRASVRLGHGFMLSLVGGFGDVLFVLGCAFFRCRVVMDSARAAAIGHMVVVDDGVSFHNGPVDIGGMDNGAIHIDHSRVIGKMPATPLSAGKADSAVAKAIVDAAIITDVPPPVAFMKDKQAVGPAPVARSPQKAWLRSWHPCARNPIVISLIGTVGPIARGPDHVRLRARRLHIYRQPRRPEVNTDGELSVQERGDKSDNHRQQKPARGA